MNRLTKFTVVSGLIASLAVGGASCGNSSSAAAPYKIGAVLAVSGINSSIGTPEKQTLEMLTDQINAKGGINGHPLQVIIYDTQSDTTQAVTLVKKLIEQDNVSAIIGPSSTGESLAVTDTVVKAGVPLVALAAASQITDPVADKKWIFTTAQSNTIATNAIIDNMNSSGIKKMALFVDSAGYGTMGQQVLQDLLPKAGFTIVDTEKFGSTDTDMTTQLTKIKGTDAQAIIVWGTNPGPAVVARNARQLGITIPLIMSHGVANQDFINLAGDAANGVILPAGKILIVDQLPDSNPQKAVLLKYKADFEAKFGAGTASHFGGHADDALTMISQALASVGDDRTKIRDFLENNIKNFAGVSGVFTYSTTDHAGLTKDALVMLKIVDGKWTWINK